MFLCCVRVGKGCGLSRYWAFGHFGCGSFAESPMAWVSILLETNIGPMSSKGTIICQGNLVEAKAMLKKAGSAIAASQRMVFHLSRFFFSVFFMCVFF